MLGSKSCNYILTLSNLTIFFNIMRMNTIFLWFLPSQSILRRLSRQNENARFSRHLDPLRIAIIVNGRNMPLAPSSKYQTSGLPRIKEPLRHQHGEVVNHKLLRKLLRLWGLSLRRVRSRGKKRLRGLGIKSIEGVIFHLINLIS